MRRSQALPDPDTLNDADVVIYDGQCNFCRSQVNTLRRFDLGGQRLSYLSLHDPRIAQHCPDLSHDQLMQQMYVVDRRGHRHGGADAVRYLTRRLPLLWIVAPLLHLPGTANIWRWLYGLVAKQRYRLAGKSCEHDACGLHVK